MKSPIRPKQPPHQELGNAREPEPADTIERRPQSSRIENTTTTTISSRLPSSSSAVESTLQHEKQKISYPKVAAERKKQQQVITNSKTTDIAAPCTSDRGAPISRGLRAKKSPTRYEKDKDKDDAHPEKQLYFLKEESPSSLSKKIHESNPAYASHMKERSLLKKGNFRSSKENPNNISRVASISDERSPPSNHNNNPLLPADLEPMAMPAAPPTREVDPPPIPGAYAATDNSLPAQRLDQLNFSLIGQSTTIAQDFETNPSPNLTGSGLSHQLHSPDMERGSGEDMTRGTGYEEPRPTVSTTTTANTTIPNLDNHNNNGDSGLVEAEPVSATFDRPSRTTLAQPVDEDHRHAARRKARENYHKRIAYGIVAIAFLVLVVSLALVFTTKAAKDTANDMAAATTDEAPSPSPTTGSSSSPLLPPMDENLEFLYQGLPETSRERLYDRESPQYRAWDWLQNHPNLNSYPEWRKKQVFAMATLFYSFEGPSWSQKTASRSRWINPNIHECGWSLSDSEIGHYIQVANKVLGPDTYGDEVYRSCNGNGEIQTLILHQLLLPPDRTPSIPPEIELLTSVRILGIAFSQLNVPLSDLVLPILELPSLRTLILRSNGAHGTIPKQIHRMTGLRHLLIGANALSGSIPTEIARMTSLEHINIGDEEGLGGPLPSELGLMTKLTGLEIYRSSLTGTIPSQLGSLNKIRELALAVNLMSGNIPSQLGLMTTMNYFYLDNNGLTGPIPSELGLMTNVLDFRLGNYPRAQISAVQVHRNDLSGSLPNELWELSHLKWLHLSDLPNLHGSVPPEVVMPNLTMLSLSGSSHLSGTIPDEACASVDELDFDCSDLLCGCDCRCGESGNKTNLRS